MPQKVSTFPVIPSQVAFRLVDKCRPGLTAIGFEQPVADDVEPEPLARAVSASCRRHETLRTTILDNHDVDPDCAEYVWRGFRNVVADEPVVSFDVGGGTDPPAVDPHAASLPTGEPAWLPNNRVDPGELPVFQFRLVDGHPHRRLRVVTDHALCDRWSLFALQRDIERFYRQELTGSAQHVAPAYPFSAFATELHAHWARGGFDERLRTTVETVRALDMSALADTGDRPPDAALVQSFVVSLSDRSTRRFDAAHGRLGGTRLAVAIALFADAIATEFGWDHLAFLVPHANRAVNALNSVGLFADAHYVFTNRTDGLQATARVVARTLEEARTTVPPPAALVQATPGASEILRVVPRLAADVTIQPRRTPPRRGAAAVVFVQPRSTDADADASADTVVPSTPPSFPAQPDLRLTCDFAQQHRLSVNYRVDHVARAAAEAVAHRLLTSIHRLPL